MTDPAPVFPPIPALCGKKVSAAFDGGRIASDVRRLLRRIRRHWPETRILLRGDGHYARPEVMAFCEAQDGVDYLFGMPATAAGRWSIGGGVQVFRVSSRSRSR